MLMDYPGLIMKFTLLVQAGLTARKAFQKIALDYGKREDGKKREAYEEIRVACYEMDSGISEAEAYRRFGERCGQVKYKTLSTLLIQNLQKGSRYLADLLEKESVEAWEERKRKARVLGDTAATKLLLPMVLMLLVVMEEDAGGVVEIILILVVLISLVIIFKEQLTALVKKILTKITKQSNTI